MNVQPNQPFSSRSTEEIKELRRQLAQYHPIAGSLEVIFTLPTGAQVRVPVSNPAKIRLLSQEVRNYLAEEQLMTQCHVN